MPEYKSTPKIPSSNKTIGRTETEWHKEGPLSCNSYPTEAKEWEGIHRSNHQDSNQESCGNVARKSTELVHVSKTSITAPRHAHIPNEREPISGYKRQAASTTEPTSPGWSCKKTPYNPCRAEPIEAPITAPSQVHFPVERSFEQATKKHSPKIEALNSPLGDLNRESSLNGRKRCNGFDKTRELLAQILMERTSCINRSASRPHARSFEKLTPSNQVLYDKAADGFIKWALEFYMKSKDSYGPGTTVHDFMIVKLMNEEYGLPEDGETKEYLYGERECLWAVDDDGILENEMPVPAEMIQLPHPPSSKNRLWVWRKLILTAKDWRWWCGEWKKVPGAIWEWYPREEIWPWQRSY